MQRWTRLSF